MTRTVFRLSTLITLAIAPVFADTLTFGAGGTTGGKDLGSTSITLTLGTTSFGVAGFNGGNLAAKCCDSGEIGLGLTGDPTHDNEIYHKSTGTQDFIQLNLTNLINAGYTGFTFTMDSVTGDDGYLISECSSAGVDCGTTATISLADPYVDFRATGGNVLLDSISATNSRGNNTAPVPEPTSIVLLGTVLAFGGKFLKGRLAA